MKYGKICAIKVLSAESKQGAHEFLAEIKSFSDIQHENLVKLPGCWAADDHRMLVHEYLENNSLAQTLIDFGPAKLIPTNMTHVSTRMAGTIGYLAPEYAIQGKLTHKADIYSFGVLLVEIVSGRCNTNTQLPVDEQYLLERVWDFYERRELVGLTDVSLNGDFDVEEACRFLKIGLLCTQDTPRLQPSMSTVVKMLTVRGM